MPKTNSSKQDDGALKATEKRKSKTWWKLVFKLWLLAVRLIRWFLLDDLE